MAEPFRAHQARTAAQIWGPTGPGPHSAGGLPLGLQVAVQGCSQPPPLGKLEILKSRRLAPPAIDGQRALDPFRGSVVGAKDLSSRRLFLRPNWHTEGAWKVALARLG